MTNALKKEISSLATAKGRRKSGAFMAEGTKCVLDTIASFKPRYIVATEQWLEEHALCEDLRACIVIANRGEIGQISSMSLAPDVIAVYELPEAPEFKPAALAGKLIVALDCIQDPGNLGTIMRTADWMGVETVIASNDTVDCFNPKVVQATMGAISRVKVIYGDLPAMIDAFPKETAVYGTFLDGENLYTSKLSETGIIVMGNEGKGISDAVARTVTRRLLIPSFPTGRTTSESLNVATATAITLAQFRSKSFIHGQSEV